MIGRYTPLSSRLFVASGFMKWGLTSGTFAGEILRDLIARAGERLGRALQPACGFLPAARAEVAQLGAKFSGDFVLDRVAGRCCSVTEVPGRRGPRVRDGIGKAGVYRDEEGRSRGFAPLHPPRVPPALQRRRASWDCPCHGSRFGVDGDVLEGTGDGTARAALS